MAEPEVEEGGKPGKRRAGKSGSGKALASTNRIRSLAASAIWLLAVVLALVLAVGALLVALQLNRDNPIVDFVLTMANAIDFGVFKDFEADPPKNPSKAEIRDAKQSAETKSVMVNWGLAAVIYLVAGKVLERVIRPKKG